MQEAEDFWAPILFYQTSWARQDLPLLLLPLASSDTLGGKTVATVMSTGFCEKWVYRVSRQWNGKPEVSKWPGWWTGVKLHSSICKWNFKKVYNVNLCSVASDPAQFCFSRGGAAGIYMFSSENTCCLLLLKSVQYLYTVQKMIKGKPFWSRTTSWDVWAGKGQQPNNSNKVVKIARNESSESGVESTHKTVSIKTFPLFFKWTTCVLYEHTTVGSKICANNNDISDHKMSAKFCSVGLEDRKGEEEV